MLTQCAHCKKTYNLSIAELRVSSTLLCCPHCADMLGRLNLFSPDFFFTGKNDKPLQLWLWSLGSIVSLLLLMTQIYWVEREKISQNPQQRVWLEKICQSLPCHLPVYQNLDEFEILHGDFQLQDSHYVFQTVLSNQADFQQQYPRIKLNLLDFTGHIFAERVFFPAEYLNSQPTALMQPSETIEVNLNIALPAQKVGGYTFELL